MPKSVPCYIRVRLSPVFMWVEIIVGGSLVTFSQAGICMNSLGVDPRCEWAPRIEAGARRICGRADGVRFSCDRGDLRINLHEDAVGPVVRAITDALPSMPPEIHGFFQRICYLLENGERVGILDLASLRLRTDSISK
jgi:hypothetical protein